VDVQRDGGVVWDDVRWALPFKGGGEAVGVR